MVTFNNQQYHRPLQQQDLDEDTEEECRRLRKLQNFRERNADALISLPSATIAAATTTSSNITSTSISRGAPNTDGSDDSEGTNTSPRGTHHHHNNAAEERKVRNRHRQHILVPYRRNHLTCSLMPTVTCSKLDHTRPGHPSDAPPLVNPEVDDVDLVDMMIRLVIPNTAPTSIHSADHRRLCMALATDQGGDLLSIAHQRLGLEAGGGGGRRHRDLTANGDDAECSTHFIF